MGLGGEVVDLVGFDGVEEAVKAARLGHVPIVEEDAGVGAVRILVEVVDALGTEGRRPASEPVHLVALVEKKLGEIRAVLPGDPGDKRALLNHGHQSYESQEDLREKERHVCACRLSSWSEISGRRTCFWSSAAPCPGISGRTPMRRATAASNSSFVGAALSAAVSTSCPHTDRPQRVKDDLAVAAWVGLGCIKSPGQAPVLRSLLRSQLWRVLSSHGRGRGFKSPHRPPTKPQVTGPKRPRAWPETRPRRRTPKSEPASSRSSVTTDAPKVTQVD